MGSHRYAEDFSDSTGEKCCFGDCFVEGCSCEGAPEHSLGSGGFLLFLRYTRRRDTLIIGSSWPGSRTQFSAQLVE